MERAVPFVASLSLTLAIAGCSLPTAALGAPDGGSSRLDAFVAVGDTGIDAFVARSDTGIDAFVVPNDTGTDAFVVPNDMGTDAFVAIDAYVAPDAFAGDASTPCDRAFGSAPGYHVCGAASTSSCTFYVVWPGGHDQSCNDACGATRCTSAVGNADRTMCTVQGGAFPCDQTFHDAICTCTP